MQHPGAVGHRAGGPLPADRRRASRSRAAKAAPTVLYPLFLCSPSCPVPRAGPPLWKEHVMTTSRPHPATARTYAAAVIGIEGHLTQAHATAANGPPGLRVTGLPDSTIRETRYRVNAAVLNSGQTWPARTITVSLLPASLPKRGTGFDLAIAVAALTAAGTVPAGAPEGCAFYSELGLDGSLRPVRGVLPALLAAA